MIINTPSLAGAVMRLLFLCLVLPLVLSACSADGSVQQHVELNSDAKHRVTSTVDRVSASLQSAHEQQALNAFIYLDDVGALAAAKRADLAETSGESLGALHGIPFVVKDNIHVVGMPNSAGTLSLRNFRPTTTNSVVEALVDAGGIVLGKTNMHELAFGITSNNAAFGAVHNAHNPELIPGGSSGGTAVAIASGMVAIGLGTDTGGSTRIPPALNGIAGFRPSMGRYGTHNVTPVASTRDTVGPLAVNVKMIALMDSVITDGQCNPQNIKLENLRLGVSRDYFYQNLSAEVAQNIERVLKKLTAAGVALVEVELPGLEQANAGVSFPVALHEAITELPEYLARNKIDLSIEQLVAAISSPDVKAALGSQLGEQAIPEAVYRDAINKYRPALQKIYADAFTQYNVSAMIAPTTPLLATPIFSSDETVELNGQQVPTFPTFIRNTDPSSNAGLPSLVFPSGRNAQNNPFSVMLDGPIDSDCSVLDIGIAMESLLSDVI